MASPGAISMAEICRVQASRMVHLLGQNGLLAEVAGRISAAHTNIEHVRVDREGDASALAFRLKVRDRRQLALVVRSIRTIPGVVRVSRSAS